MPGRFVLETLSASESFLEVALAAAAFLVALWSIAKSVRSRDEESRASGELVWSLVAAAVLAGVVAAVGLGVGHGV